MSNQDTRTNRIENIYKLVETTARSLDRIKEMLRNLEKDEEKDKYRDVAGVTGTFDGVQMISTDNQKYEVPANYAAKSRLVFGDVLKMIEEDGKKVFKQIEKIERKKVEGILTKKEGKWHIISDSGTFKISDTAAEFQQAELNDEAVAFIPAGNLNSPYAALDKVNKKLPQKIDHKAPPIAINSQVSMKKPEPVKKEKVEVQEAPQLVVEEKKAAPVHKPVVENKPPVFNNVAYKPKTSSKPSSGGYKGNSKPGMGPRKPRPAVKKEYVEDITATTIAPSASTSLDDDDLR